MDCVNLTVNESIVARKRKMKMNEELREMQRKLGWSNADLARALGVSRDGVNHWFRANPITVPVPVLRLMRLTCVVIETEGGVEILENTGMEIKERF